MADNTEYGRFEISTNADQFARDAKKIEGASKGMSANLGRSALEASRAIEDLQYGIGGVVNNIPGFVSAVGGGAGAMAAFSLAAVGIAQVTKHWNDLIASFQTRVEIPRATDDVEGLQTELGKARDRMKELGDKTSVTLPELAEFNKLRTKTVAIEKQVAEQMERQKRAKEFDALKDPATTAAEQARADILKPMFGDPENAALAKAVETAMPKDGLEGLKDSLADINAQRQMAMRNAPFGIDMTGEVKRLNAEAERLRGAITKETERIAADAKDLAARAVTGGEEGAFGQIMAMMGRQPGAFNDFQRQAFQQATPDIVKERVRQPMRDAQRKQMKKLDEDLKKRDELIEKQQQAMEAQFADPGQAAEAQRRIDDARKHQAESNRAQVEQQIDRENQSIKAGGYDVAATAQMATLQAQGGAVDQFGRFHQMTPEQIRQQVAVEVAAELKRRNPGMDKQQAEDIGTKVSLDAQKGVNDQMLAGMAKGLDQVSAMQAVVANVVGAFANLQSRFAQVDARTRQLDRQVRRPDFWNGNPIGEN